MLLKLPVLAALLLASPLAAASLSGVWSVGERRNCTAGDAWVLFADGHYVELKLPSGPMIAVGLWKDDRSALVYTHQHLPFARLASPARERRMTVITRTDNRLEMQTPSGRRLRFHRCPADALKAPVADKAHDH